MCYTIGELLTKNLKAGVFMICDLRDQEKDSVYGAQCICNRGALSIKTSNPYIKTAEACHIYCCGNFEDLCILGKPTSWTWENKDSKCSSNHKSGLLSTFFESSTVL